MITDPLGEFVSGVATELRDPRCPDFAAVARLFTSLDGTLTSKDAELRDLASEWLASSLAADLDNVLPPTD